MKYFNLPYETPVKIPKLSLALKFIDIEFISEIRGNIWSKRTAQINHLFSKDYRNHRKLVHQEYQSIDTLLIEKSNYVSFILRKDLSELIELNSIESLGVNQGINNETLIHSNLLVTSGGYTVPFHTDPYDTLIFAVKNCRLIYLFENFNEIYKKEEIELYTNSYIPASFYEGAKIKRIELKEGFGIVLKKGVPHAVQTLKTDSYTIAYTKCIESKNDTICKIKK